MLRVTRQSHCIECAIKAAHKGFRFGAFTILGILEEGGPVYICIHDSFNLVRGCGSASFLLTSIRHHTTKSNDSQHQTGFWETWKAYNWHVFLALTEVMEGKILDQQGHPSTAVYVIVLGLFLNVIFIFNPSPKVNDSEWNYAQFLRNTTTTTTNLF